jgi:hypothetical protein
MKNWLGIWEGLEVDCGNKLESVREENFTGLEGETQKFEEI